MSAVGRELGKPESGYQRDGKGYLSPLQRVESQQNRDLQYVDFIGGVCCKNPRFGLFYRGLIFVL